MEFKIEKLDNFGRGISYLDDKIIFIDNSLPGEVVDAKVIFTNKKFSEGSIVSIKEKSNDRINPICPYFCICGGCNLLHMPYSQQLDFKFDKVVKLIDKYINKDIKIKKIISSNPLNYRNKATFKVGNKLSYTKRKSTELVNIDYCYLNDNKINDVVNILNKYNLGSIKDIVIKSSDKDLMLDIRGNVSNGILESLKKISTSIYINNKLIYGKSHIEISIGDYKFIVSPKSFFQVNKYSIKELYDKILEYSNLNGEESVLDLYCGTGTIGIYLSKKAKYVVGIEKNQDAIMDANINKKINNIENISFICDTTSNINNIVKESFDVIIVDPPRSGLDKNTIEYIMNSNAKRIVYTSCDIMTLIRDLNILKDKYNIEEITPVDMFPNTYHVECVCVLNRL